MKALLAANRSSTRQDEQPSLLGNIGKSADVCTLKSCATTHHLVCLLFMLAAVASAQTKAQISGFVQDQSGAIIRDAAVSVANMNTGIRRNVRSNSEGFYAISSLSAGMYKITVRREGFRTMARVGVPIEATEVARVDFTLDVGSMQEVVTVEGSTSLLRMEDAAVGVQMGSDPAESLPLNGRGLQGLIELAPGVLPTPANAGEAGQFSTNGQRANTNYFTVDGVSANNGIGGSGLPGQFSGGALPAMTAIGSLHGLAGLGELQELRVQTSTFAPEFGRLPGAHVALTTRSGSNAFHGEAFGLFRHDALMANDWFANRAGLSKGEHRLADMGGVFGGPLQPDRTFFLASFERIHLRQPITFDTAVPTIRRGWLTAYPIANGEDLGKDAARFTAQTLSPAEVTTSSLRIDRALGTKGTMFGRFNYSPSDSTSGFLQRNETGFRSRALTLGSINAVGEGRVTNDARLNVSTTSVDSRWLPGQAETVDFERLLSPLTGGQRLWGLNIPGVPALVGGDPGTSRQTQWNFVDTVAMPAGRHDIRLGFDYQRLTPRREKGIATLVGQYPSVAAAAAGLPPNLTYGAATAGSSLIETLSVFAQDTWHATERFNVTYGLRWEWTPPPAYRTSVPVNGAAPGTVDPSRPVSPTTPTTAVDNVIGTVPDWTTRYSQFAPRLGGAYRLDRAGQLVLRAGGGLFYDLTFGSALDLLNGSPFNRWRNLLGPSIAGASEVTFGFARNLRLPYSLEWNVTLERAFGGDATASAAYVGSAGRRLLRREAQLDPTNTTPQSIIATNNGRSSYHALQLQARSRSRRGVQGVVSYTWAHAIDNGSWDSGTFVVFPGLGSAQDRGRANFDVRHNFQAALSYRLPRAWMLSGIARARSGFPVDIAVRENYFGLGFDNLRPDLTGSPWQDDPGAPGGRSLDRSAFVTPTGRQGTLGRNALNGLGLAQLDLALEREWTLSERARLRFRTEVYNATNRTSFADPVQYLSNPLFGQSTSLAGLMLGAGRPNSGLTPAFQPGGPRSLQLGFTLRF